MSKTTKTDEVLKQMIDSLDIPKFEEIEGPFNDQFTGKEYYIGTVMDGSTKMNIKFNLKYVEYGKVRVKTPVIE